MSLLRHDQVHGLSHLVAQMLHRHARHLHQIKVFHNLPAERIQARGHAVTACVLVFAHIAAAGHGRKHTVHGAFVQAGQFGERVDGQAVARRAQALHNVKRAIERLHRG